MKMMMVDLKSMPSVDSTVLPLHSEEDLDKEKSKFSVYGNHAKVAILTAFCVLSVILLSFVSELEPHTYYISVEPNQTFTFPLSRAHLNFPNTVIQLQGPFVPAIYSNYTEHSLTVEIYEECPENPKSRPEELDDLLLDYAFDSHEVEDEKNSTSKQLKDQWSIPLPSSRYLVAMPTTVVDHLYKATDLITHPGCRKSVALETDLDHSLAVQLLFFSFPERATSRVVYAAFILIGMYILITFELVPRTLAALIASTVAISVLASFDARPSMEELMDWLDIETLCLLFGMMVMVSVLSESGFFDWVAVITYEVSRGNPWLVVTYLSFFTGIISAFLDNVTTILLLTPITIRLCEVMGIDPVPVLIITVMFSNIGGAATPIGDPPNVLIVNNPDIKRAGIDFGSFTLHMALGSIFALVVVYGIVRFKYKDLKGLRHTENENTAGLKHEIATWKRTARSFSVYSRQELVVRRMLARKIRHMEEELKRTEKGQRKEVLKEDFEATLADLKSKYGIRNKPLLVKSLIVVGAVIILFFLQSIPSLQLSLGWTAILGAIVLLVLADLPFLDAHAEGQSMLQVKQTMQFISPTRSAYRGGG